MKNSWKRKKVSIQYRKKWTNKTNQGGTKNEWNRWYCKRERERESNRLEKVARNCDAKKYKDRQLKEVEKSSKKRTKKERLSNCLSFLYVKEQAGITLLTLAITILIIIILSGVTITAIVGDNGLLGQASQISDEAEAGETSREEEMNSLLQYYANVMAEDSELSLPSITKPYLDNVLAVAPDVEDGMIPVKWNGRLCSASII